VDNLSILLNKLVNDGIASYGARFAQSASDPISMKGKGYYGLLPSVEGGFATEISSTDAQGEHYPLLSPNLTEGQIKQMLQGMPPTEDIYQQAEDWAKYRRSMGMDAFASPTELRIPTNMFSGLLGE